MTKIHKPTRTQRQKLRDAIDAAHQALPWQAGKVFHAHGTDRYSISQHQSYVKMRQMSSLRGETPGAP